MSKTRTIFVCQSCGHSSPKWLGRCPECDEWGSLTEELAPTGKTSSAAATFGGSAPLQLTEIPAEGASRTPTGISEFDRALGGGIVHGSLVLLGGDPGIGKSTVLTQVAGKLAADGNRVLYVSGEESAQQIKLRANRIGIESGNLYLLSETSMEAVEHHTREMKPAYLIVDSIQTMNDTDLSSAPGTVSQVRSCTNRLANIAKQSGVPVFIVGHVTKDGFLAGPKVLEHMVDTVLYFEGDRRHSYRIIRAAKNRFGSTDELGIFEMREEGLVEVPNASEAFLAERSETGSGSVVTSTIEGTRPILVEIQALVAQSYFTSPRRTATGIDYNKMLMILAVLEKRAGMALGNKDVYVNVAGGVRIVEPAADLAVALAVASSLLDRPVDHKLLAIGEIGLAGEVRTVVQAEKRLREAARLGFTTALVASPIAESCGNVAGLRVIGTPTLAAAIRHAVLDRPEVTEE